MFMWGRFSTCSGFVTRLGGFCMLVGRPIEIGRRLKTCPTNSAVSPVLGKVSGIAYEYVRHKAPRYGGNPGSPIKALCSHFRSRAPGASTMGQVARNSSRYGPIFSTGIRSNPNAAAGEPARSR